MSAGFMGASFRRSDGDQLTGAARRRRDQRQGRRMRAPTKTLIFRKDPAGPATGRTEIIAKLVQTRAHHRSFASNEARLSLMRG